MSKSTKTAAGAGPSQRGVEIGVALFIALLGAISIYGGLQVGIGWAAEGPRAGFFPFYVGLAVVIACAVNLFTIVAADEDGALFAEWAPLRQVVSVVVPTAIYVALVPYLGIYVASALLIFAFMMWFGGYKWPVAVPVAVLVPVATFFMFEIWFLVPLPKGPLEKLLGY